MVKADIPNVIEMRRLKYDPKSSAEERDRAAAALRAQDRRIEALLLYEGRADHPDLEGDAAWAVETGSAFALSALERLGFPVTDDRRRACAQAAEAQGRWYDAHVLYEKLKDEASLARVQEHIPGFRVAIPENKKEPPAAPVA